MNLLETLESKFQEYENQDDTELDEMSATGNLDGGAGPPKTPKSFKKKKTKRKVKNSDKPFDTIAKESKYKRMANDLFLNEVNYRDFKKDDDRTAKHKVNSRLKEINGLLYKMEIMVKQAKKLKSEAGLTQDKIWKSNESRILKIKERLLKIAKDIVEINS